MVDIITEDIDVVASSGVVVETAEEVVIDGIERDIEVTFDNNEFSIVGDDMVVLTRYEDAPQWMKDVINNLIDVKASLVVGDLDATREALDTMLAQLEVAKNTYELSIVSSNDIDQRITTAIETLNSSLQAADATILNIAQTAVTPSEASAIALNALSASLAANGTIGSTISNLQAAFADLESTTAQDVSYLESVMQGEIEGNATAMETIRTYVGIDENGGITGTGLLTDVKILQKQNDGVIETTTGTWDVMIGIENPNNNTDNDQLDITQEPYATWKALDVVSGNTENRSAHVGDVYIKYTNATEGYKTYDKAYKFIKVTPDGSSPYSTDTEGFTWALITDTDVQNAYVAALNALDLADSKRRVFTDVPTIPYDAGDLWVRVVNGSNQIWRCNIDGATSYSIAHWTIASTDDTATVALQTGLENGTAVVKLTNAYVGTVPFTTYIASEIDNKVGVYSGETAPVAGQPSGVAVNDIYLWFTTASKVLANGTTQVYDITRTYKYSGSAWTEITTDSNITALADLADGKRTVFSGNSVPTGAVNRDVWIPSGTNGIYLQGEIYQYNGTSWIIATKYTENLDNFVGNVYEPAISDLQSQVDGQINYYFYESSLSQTPASISGSAGWNTEAKKEHHGDIAYDKTTNAGYYYDRITATWIAITGSENAGVIEALKAAATAQATADGVVVSYYAIKQDVAPATANLWLNKTGAKVLKRYVSSWVNVDVKVGDTLTAYDPDTKDISIYVYDGSSWITNTENGIVATSEWGVDLNAYLDNKAVGGTTSLISDISATSNNNLSKAVNSRFAYNSDLVVDGVTYTSGFGLSNSAGTGIGSEFWINADKFRFTNTAKTGSKAPFSIDASGPTPEVTFNGKVTFSNVTGTTGTGSNLLYNSAPKIGSETKGWYIWTNSGMTVNLSAGWNEWKPTGGASVAANIGGNPSIGSVFDVGQSSRFPVIAGSRYEASAYISAHRSNSFVFLMFYDAAGNYASDASGNVINYAGGGALVNWGRSSVFATAPGNAATVSLIVRSEVTGSDPYCFVANAFAGVAEANQTTPSNWSEGTSVGAMYTSELSNDAGFVLPAGVANAINTNTTTINGSKITTGTVAADQIYSDSALINKLNVTGGLVANNLRVPGVNGGNDLLSASGDKVVISNLKVLGTVSMPGISKGGSFTVPSLSIWSSHTVYVNKPYECSSWSLTAIVTLTNGTGNGIPLNFGCRLYVDGIHVSTAQGAGAWAINIGCSGTKGSIYANTVPITIQTSDFGDGAGSFYGTISYIAIVEN